jgi:hypothetical protein
MYNFSSGNQRGATQDAVLVIRNDPDHPGHITVVSKQGGTPL